MAVPPCAMQKDGSEWDVVSAITLFSKYWVKAEGMAYEDGADSPTTESDDSEGSDFEVRHGSNAALLNCEHLCGTDEQLPAPPQVVTHTCPAVWPFLINKVPPAWMSVNTHTLRTREVAQGQQCQVSNVATPRQLPGAS